MTKYEPLKRYVASRGGMRLAAHRGIRDRLIEMAVEEWPDECVPGKQYEVLRARMRLRVRREYGSLLALFLISVVVNIVARLVVDWWLDRSANRVLMAGWRV